MSRAPRARARRGPRSACLLVALGLAAAAAGCGGGAARAQDGDPGCGEARWLAPLPPELAEASGMARDPRRQDVFWLHNDSDNELAVQAVDTAGRLLAYHRVRTATHVDAEDLALGRCGERHCLYLGDIGDNLSLRREIQVHRLPLPLLPPAGDDGAPEAEPLRGTVGIERTLRLRYPDRPWDAEGLVVDDRRREILIVTKGREGSAVLYAAPLEPLGEGAAELRRIGPLRVPLGRNTGQLLTAADLSPDGRHLAVRSYTNLFLFPWRGAGAFDSTAVPAESPLLAATEPQGEGLSFGEDPGAIYLASESRGGRPPQLSRVTCPGLGR